MLNDADVVALGDRNGAIAAVGINNNYVIGELGGFNTSGDINFFVVGQDINGEHGAVDRLNFGYKKTRERLRIVGCAFDDFDNIAKDR